MCLSLLNVVPLRMIHLRYEDINFWISTEKVFHFFVSRSISPREEFPPFNPLLGIDFFNSHNLWCLLKVRPIHVSSNFGQRHFTAVSLIFISNRGNMLTSTHVFLNISILATFLLLPIPLLIFVIATISKCIHQFWSNHRPIDIPI